MHYRNGMRLRAPGLALLAVALAGCGTVDVNLWPFGESGPAEIARSGPVNAAEYRCADGKRFHVRMLESGDVWLFAPDRGIRLERVSTAQGRYAVGKVTLELSGDTATLIDPPATYADCKKPAPA